MRRNVFLGLLMAFTIVSCQDKTATTKESTSNEQFAALGNQPSFAEQHEEPEPINVAAKGEMRTFPVEGGEDGRAYFINEPKEGQKYLLVVHEWWGLNDHIKQEADRWFGKLKNVNVIALDLYDGKVGETREEARNLMQSAEKERLTAIINAVLDMIGEEAQVATIGWCFGGGWSMQSALLAKERTKACVVYYGMPELDEERLNTMSGDLLFIYGKKDQWINEEVADKLKESMQNVNKPFTIKAFDADHAFANPSSPRYIEQAATEANEIALAFLKEHL